MYFTTKPAKLLWMAIRKAMLLLKSAKRMISLLLKSIICTSLVHEDSRGSGALLVTLKLTHLRYQNQQAHTTAASGASLKEETRQQEQPRSNGLQPTSDGLQPKNRNTAKHTPAAAR